MLWLEIIIKLLLIVALLLIIIPFLRSGFGGAFFAPSDARAIQDMIRLLAPEANDTVVDIGSGDGRVLIVLGRMSIHSIGIERNRILVWIARMRIRRAGLSDYAQVVHADVWSYSFHQTTHITLFGIPYIMKPLEHKLRTELPPQAKIAVNRFTFPTLSPIEKRGSVYLYTIQHKNAA